MPPLVRLCREGDDMAGEGRQAKTWREQLRGEALTLAVAGLGGAIFTLIGIPGGALAGSVVAVAVLSAFERASPISAPLRILGLSSMGVAIGSVVGPETFANIAHYPVSIALMCVAVVAMTAASGAVWSLVFRWPPTMSLLSSVPGSSSYIVSVSMTMGADATRVAVVQMSRLIFLVTTLPWIVAFEQGGHFGAPPALVIDPLMVLVPILAIGILFGHGLDRIGMAGGMLLAPLIVSGLAHFMGWAPGRIPAWWLQIGQTMLGAWVGSRFVGFDWRLFGRICVGTAASVGAAMAVCVAFAALAARLFDVSFGTALIAYAPGAQDAMMVLALSLGVDPIFVSAHHLARYFVINVSLPILIAWLRRVDARKAAEHTAP
jgi:membrane AbrB-like protein